MHIEFGNIKKDHYIKKAFTEISRIGLEESRVNWKLTNVVYQVSFIAFETYISS